MYATISVIASDPALRARVAGCAATEDEAVPENWAYVNAYAYAASPGWASKWEAAKVAGKTNIGGDTSVITDGDILSTVQQLRT